MELISSLDKVEADLQALHHLNHRSDDVKLVWENLFTNIKKRTKKKSRSGNLVPELTEQREPSSLKTSKPNTHTCPHAYHFNKPLIRTGTRLFLLLFVCMPVSYY